MVNYTTLNRLHLEIENMALENLLHDVKHRLWIFRKQNLDEENHMKIIKLEAIQNFLESRLEEIDKKLGGAANE